MKHTTLGRTGLKVSVAGIGSGGPSQLGRRYGADEAQSIAVIRAGVDAGVNFIDTAEAYGTEEIVGKAIADLPRDSVVLSTKLSTWDETDNIDVEGRVDESLRKLGTDYIDIYHLHAVTRETYPRLVKTVVPVLDRVREKGKVRYLGITERFHADPGHQMLDLALDDDIWDVMMVGFNILNQSARSRVFPRTIAKNIGVLAMFAVRLALSRPERLREVVADLLRRGEVEGVYPNDPLRCIADSAGSTVEAAYRFVAHEPGIHVTLSGTGDVEHMQSNVQAIQMPPLPDAVREELHRAFGGVDSVSAQ